MLKRGLCCLLLPTLLLTTSSNIIPLRTKPLMDRELNNNSYYIHSELDKQLEEYLKEQEKIRIEELRLKELEIEKQRQAEKSKEQTVNLLITYYGDTPSQTSGYGVMANGEKPHYGAIACPKEIPIGSELKFNGKTFICKDRGNPKYICQLSDGTYRVDIFIPQYDNESIYEYEKRVRDYGTDRLQAQLIIKE